MNTLEIERFHADLTIWRSSSTLRPGEHKEQLFVGIIDILTKYGAKKMAAHNAKMIKHGVSLHSFPGREGGSVHAGDSAVSFLTPGIFFVPTMRWPIWLMSPHSRRRNLSSPAITLDQNAPLWVLSFSRGVPPPSLLLLIAPHFVFNLHVVVFFGGGGSVGILPSQTKAEISTVNPEQYSARFIKFISDNAE